jgi:hypothetical protein
MISRVINVLVELQRIGSWRKEFEFFGRVNQMHFHNLDIPWIKNNGFWWQLEQLVRKFGKILIQRALKAYDQRE